MKVIVAIFLSGMLLATQGTAYESISYLFAGNTTTYVRSVERTGASLSIVCPDYFEINPDGTLKKTLKYDRAFVETMQAKGIRVTPYLSNNWDRVLGRAAVANRVGFAQALAKAVADLGCDGVNIDLQNLTEVDRATFTDFIRLVRQALPDEKILSVCVAPNPWGFNTGWQGSYDYAAIGVLCDQLFIMAYDEHYSGGDPGAVASLSFVEKSVQYALKKVPASKIILGVPFYGRYWKQGATRGGYGITMADTERLSAQLNAVTWYDTTAQCARATLTVKSTDTAYIWGSNRLSAGVYDIWYENEISLEKKLALVSKYNLGGAGSWALGQEPDSVWTKYTAWLKGLPFVDINGHWAQSYIIGLTERTLVSGFPDRKFRPNEAMTRAEAAVLFVRMAGLENETGDETFADVVGHWAEGAISVAKKYRIFSGYAGNLFFPDRTITREEFAVICDRVLLSADTVDFSQSIYRDVSPEGNAWSNKSIVLLSMNEILQGYGDGTFRPHQTITRAEVTTAVTRMLEYPGGFAVAPGIINPPDPIQPR